MLFGEYIEKNEQDLKDNAYQQQQLFREIVLGSQKLLKTIKEKENFGYKAEQFDELYNLFAELKTLYRLEGELENQITKAMFGISSEQKPNIDKKSMELTKYELATLFHVLCIGDVEGTFTDDVSFDAHSKAIKIASVGGEDAVHSNLKSTISKIEKMIVEV